MQFVQDENALRDFGKIETEQFREACECEAFRNTASCVIVWFLHSRLINCPGLYLLTDAPDQGLRGLRGVMCRPLSLPWVPKWAFGPELQHVLAFSVRPLCFSALAVRMLGADVWKLPWTIFINFPREEFRKKGRPSYVSESTPKASPVCLNRLGLRSVSSVPAMCSYAGIQSQKKKYFHLIKKLSLFCPVWTKYVVMMLNRRCWWNLYCDQS